MKALCLSFALAMVFIGCEPVTTITPLSQKYFPAKSENCEIQILTEAPTTRKFLEIAILNTVTTSSFDGKDFNAMLPSIRKVACNLGADAILIKNIEPGNPQYQASVGKAYTVAIKFID